MNKQISTPWAAAIVVLVLLVLGVVLWRFMAPPAPLALGGPTGGPASRTLGHAGYPPPAPAPPGPR